MPVWNLNFAEVAAAASDTSAASSSPSTAAAASATSASEADAVVVSFPMFRRFESGLALDWKQQNQRRIKKKNTFDKD